MVLIQVLLGRAVAYLQVGHLLLQFLLFSFASLFFLFLSFLISFLLSLDLSELLEHVLVMEQRVGKFFFENFSLKEARDAHLNAGNLEQLVHCGSLRGVPLQHHRDQG